MLLLKLILFIVPAHSASFSGQTEMNGISYSDYAAFEQDWKMITVRYRTDTQEQRFVWANPLAMQALEKGSKEFPDGSVFAKIGFITEEDSAFKSSKVPSGAVRYQFMVRDKKRYASTGGWGYALFDGDKVTYDVDPISQAQACYACHQLVPERGEVFSQILKISPFAYKRAVDTARRSDVGVVKFETINFEQLPELVRRNIPKVKHIRVVKGKLREHVFRGTIDEIRPSLVDEAKRSGHPAALIAKDNQQFTIVHADSSRVGCSKDKSFKSIFSTNVASSAKGAEPLLVVAFQNLCL